MVIPVAAFVPACAAAALPAATAALPVVPAAFAAFALPKAVFIVPPKSLTLSMIFVPLKSIATSASALTRKATLPAFISASLPMEPPAIDAAIPSELPTIPSLLGLYPRFLSSSSAEAPDVALGLRLVTFTVGVFFASAARALALSFFESSAISLLASSFDKNLPVSLFMYLPL